MATFDQWFVDNVAVGEKGFAGHAGRPGKVGGSAPKTGAARAVRVIAASMIGGAARGAIKGRALIGKEKHGTLIGAAVGAVAGGARGAHMLQMEKKLGRRLSINEYRRELKKARTKTVKNVVKKAIAFAKSGGVPGAIVRKIKSKGLSEPEWYEMEVGEKEVIQFTEAELNDFEVAVDTAFDIMDMVDPVVDEALEDASA